MSNFIFYKNRIPNGAGADIMSAIINPVGAKLIVTSIQEGKSSGNDFANLA
jgi:hypothetical protein